MSERAKRFGRALPREPREQLPRRRTRRTLYDDIPADAVAASVGGDGRCVLGHALAAYGAAENMPGPISASKKLGIRVEHATQIIEANDAGDFATAWRLLDAALETMRAPLAAEAPRESPSGVEPLGLGDRIAAEMAVLASRRTAVRV